MRSLKIEEMVWGHCSVFIIEVEVKNDLDRDSTEGGLFKDGGPISSRIMEIVDAG